MPTDRPVLVPDFLYGTAWKEERTAALVELALRVGFRGIDTANQRRHYLEAGVARASPPPNGGLVTREDLFLQTKFTYEAGQDHRLPYDPRPPSDSGRAVDGEFARASRNRLRGQLRSARARLRLRAGRDADAEVWGAMRRSATPAAPGCSASAMSPCDTSEQMAAAHADPPTFVQNRCFAHRGWDRDVRGSAGAQHRLSGVLAAHRQSGRAAPPARRRHRRAPGVTPAQVVFRFALAVGMLPLTGTSDPAHMTQDLASHELTLSADDVRAPSNR